MYSQKLKQQINQQLHNRGYETHSLESQPLTHLYNVLWEGTGHWCMTHRVSRPELDGEQCLLRQIADTVVWENNIPKGWYRYEDEYETTVLADGTRQRQLRGNIKRDKVDTQKIDASFSAGKSDTDIVGTYTARGHHKGKEVTNVMYLTKASLRLFLFSRNRGKGSCTIQQWVQPQNGVHNDVIQAVWTSGIKCMIERRRNRHKLNDESLPLTERAVTFDGPPHLSREINLSHLLKDKVKKACKSIADHFALNSQAQKGTKHYISRMVVQFKIDRQSKLILLGITGVRVFAVGRTSDLLVALNLGLKYHHLPEAQEDSFCGTSPRETRFSVIEPGIVRRKRTMVADEKKGRAIKKLLACNKIIHDSVQELRQRTVHPQTSPERWKLLRNAVCAGYFRVSENAVTLKQDIEDTCYMITSHHLARWKRDFQFSLRPVCVQLRSVVQGFLASLQLEIDPNFTTKVIAYSTPTASLFAVHMGEVERDLAAERVTSVLESLRESFAILPTAMVAFGTSKRAGFETDSNTPREADGDGDGDVSSSALEGNTAPPLEGSSEHSSDTEEEANSTTTSGDNESTAQESSVEARGGVRAGKDTPPQASGSPPASPDTVSVSGSSSYNESEGD